MRIMDSSSSGTWSIRKSWKNTGIQIVTCLSSLSAFLSVCIAVYLCLSVILVSLFRFIT